MATLTAQKILRTGVEPTYASAAAGGDEFLRTSGTFIHVKNGAVALTITIDSIASCDQGFDHNETVDVPATEERMIGPFPKRFADTNGLVQLTYDDESNVTLAVLDLP